MMLKDKDIALCDFYSQKDLFLCCPWGRLREGQEHQWPSEQRLLPKASPGRRPVVLGHLSLRGQLRQTLGTVWQQV